VPHHYSVGVSPLPRPSRTLGLALVAAVGACADSAAPARPDVVLISLDSVRADALTFVDPERTPNLTELARRGVVFRQALSGSSWTLPTHVQMFTGTPPPVHGVRLDDARIDPRMPTLPELLDAHGYHTVGFWTGWYLAGDYGFERGFDRYHNAMTDGERYDAALRAARAGADPRSIERAKIQRDVANHRDVTSERACELAADAIASAPQDEPLFLFLHLFDPHYDYVPPPPYDRRFDPDYEGTIDGRDYWHNRAIYDKTKTPPRQIGERDLEHIRALYAGEVAWCDAQIARVLGALERHDRLADALILVTSDHGEEFFERGGRGHRHTLHDELLRVPLLIVPPGSLRRAPAFDDRQVELSDLLPTICDYAGVDEPASSLGRSLRPALEGRAAERTDVPLVATLTSRPERPDGDFDTVLLQAFRTPEQKLVRKLQIGPRGRPALTHIAWFDLEKDPLERSPVLDPRDPRLRAAWNRLEERYAELRAHSERLDSSPPDERTTAIKEAFADDLSALGYVEGGADTAESQPPWLFQPLPPMRLP